jgi:hypothetical protein
MQRPSGGNASDSGVPSAGDGRWIPVEHFRPDIPGGVNALLLWVKDEWGNVLPVKVPTRALPGPAAVAGMAAAGWILALLVALLLAPISPFANSLLMNPFLRKYGSFGSVPVLLTTLAPLRRHVMRRYLREVRRDTDLHEWESRFVLPAPEFSPERLLHRLRDHGTLLLLGRSGIGKTFLVRYLVAWLAAGRATGPAKGLIPVFLPLARFQGEEPESMFFSALNSFGQVSDRELSDWFLRSGGFLVCFDGVNEVDESVLQKVSAFVNRNGRANRICLTSQVFDPRFEGVETLSLVPLDRAGVEAMIRKRLPAERVGTVLAELTDDVYSEYQLPQDLEFALGLVEQGSPLPRERGKLYQQILAPVFDAWRTAGQGDYRELVCERAYEMLCTNDPFFESGSRRFPDAVLNELRERRFLVPRGKDLLFRHDLVRAFLAAQHFRPEWQRLMGTSGVDVDSNWLPMLQFTVADLSDPVEVRDLHLAVLDKSPRVAAELFRWTVSAHPSKCSLWRTDFERRYGARDLRDGGPA